jgi:hypothetical protein
MPSGVVEVSCSVAPHSGYFSHWARELVALAGLSRPLSRSIASAIQEPCRSLRRARLGHPVRECSVCSARGAYSRSYTLRYCIICISSGSSLPGAYLQCMLSLERLVTECLSDIGHIALGYIVAKHSGEVAIFPQPTLFQRQLKARLVHRVLGQFTHVDC